MVKPVEDENLEFIDTEKTTADLEKDAAKLQNLPKYSELPKEGEEGKKKENEAIYSDDELEVEIAAENPAVDPATPEKKEGDEATAEPAAGGEGDGEVAALTEGEAAAIEEPGEPVDEDLKQYSPEIQKIVMGERQKAADRERGYEDRLTQTKEANDAQLHNKAIEADSAKYTALLAIEDSLHSDLEGKKRLLLEAKEEGKTEDEVKLLTEISGLQQRIGKLGDSKDAFGKKYGTDDKGNVKFPDAREVRQVAETTTPRSSSASSSWNGFDAAKLPTEARSWYEKNKSVLQGFDLGDILEMDKVVSGTGLQNSDPKYYDKFNDLIRWKHGDAKLVGSRATGAPAAKIPEKKVETPPAKPAAPAAAKPKNPVAPVKPTPSNESKVSKTKVVLSPDQLVNMRRYNLDPGNPAHIKAYAEAVREGQNA